MYGALSRDTFGKLNPKQPVTIKKKWPYTRLGGGCYFSGNVGLLALGGISSDPGQAAGGFGLLIAASLFSAAEDRPKLFAAACAVAIPSMIATNWTALQAGDPWAWAGTSIFVAGYLEGVFSGPLSKAFKNSKNEILKWALGKPRQVMGALSAVSKGALLYGALANHKWGFAAVLVTWVLGDYFIFRSSPHKAKNKNRAVLLKWNRPSSPPRPCLDKLQPAGFFPLSR